MAQDDRHDDRGPAIFARVRCDMATADGVRKLRMTGSRGVCGVLGVCCQFAGLLAGAA